MPGTIAGIKSKGSLVVPNHDIDHITIRRNYMGSRDTYLIEITGCDNSVFEQIKNLFVNEEIPDLVIRMDNE